jgi:hypothetical protein
VQEDSLDTTSVGAGGPIEGSSEVHGVDCLDHLRDESFFSGLKKFVDAEALAIHVAGGLDLRASGTCWRHEGAGVHRCDPWGRERKSCIACSRENEAKVAIGSSTKSGRNSSSIGFDLVGKKPQGVIHGLAMNLREHRVREVSVLDTGKKMTRQHGWRGIKITKLCNY